MNYCVCGFPTREVSGFCRPCQRRMSDLAAAGPELGPWAAPSDPGDCTVRTYFDEGWWCKACQRHHRPARVRPRRRRSPKANPRGRDDLEALRRDAARGGLREKVRYVEELDRRGRGSEWREWLALGKRLDMLAARCRSELDLLVGAEFETKFLEGKTILRVSWDDWVDLHFFQPVRVKVIGTGVFVDFNQRRVECFVDLEPALRSELASNVSALSGHLVDDCEEFSAIVAYVDPEGRWWHGGLVDERDAPWVAAGLKPPEWTKEREDAAG